MSDRIIFVCSNCKSILKNSAVCVACENKKSAETDQNERNLREVLKVFNDFKFIPAGTSPEAMRVAIISCSKNKQKGTHPAQELYNSPLFKASIAHALKNFDQVYILSAKYGLIHPEARIRSYDMSLKRMSGEKRHRWAQMTAAQMLDRIPHGSEIYFFCGKIYREKIMSFPIMQKKFRLYAPLKGLSIGKQLQWFRSHNKNKTRS